MAPMPTLLSLLAPLCLLQSVEYRSPAGVDYRAQRDTGAIARAESALAAEPRNVEKIIALGVAQSGVRQYREAIATFTRGVGIAPNNALLYRWRGHRYLSTRQFDKAMADLQRGARLDSTIYGIWYHLGIVKFVRRDFAGHFAELRTQSRRLCRRHERRQGDGHQERQQHDRQRGCERCQHNQHAARHQHGYKEWRNRVGVEQLDELDVAQ